MLKGKVAVVTGGTRGIGFAIVKKYLENGATVVLCGSRQETADKAVKELKEINPNYNVGGIGLDLNNPEEVEKQFNRIKDQYGSLDILVNNAGISQRESIYDLKPEEFDNILELNVNAMFYCSQVAAKIMKPQGGGVILNTSSMVSIYGQSTGVGYPTSKFAVNGMTKSLARELGKDNIRVNAVAPGVTNTDMVKALPDEIIKPLIATIPLGRVGEPEDVANAFLYLASDMASYVTGEILSVDGAARS
ncbi:SDR family NAD(P)-dependent oxidoreductase [Sporanaerobacter acetigenes]|uniref:7-alpha-hydroxysteroid dehydrogenase n=1 Tax=Sporanaerobacter acetigenes DSM 13106 TaxID=1123281 RepID=A0A1M5YA13_9FIRM|nr:3-oxoacyl-ACP reductase family protein [Sporanaerobacter acetigenes]SHI08759.1 7-alpha-hydroxysteroid dehydrogenase [Sporanaerobacter acetigenes DSM 13106]